MPKKTIVINLDVMNKDIFPMFSVKQFDDITLIAKITNDGVPMQLSGKCIFYVGCGGEVYKQETDVILSNDTVTIQVDKNLLSENGRAFAEIETTDQEGSITTTTFTFDIDRKVGEGSTVPGIVEGFVERYKRAIAEFKVSGNKVVTDLEEDYSNLKRIIISENQAADLQNQVNRTNSQLETNTNYLDDKINDLDNNKTSLNYVNSKVWSMANMGQDVKESMTGGSVAVVGKDAVLEDNIVDGQVTQNKTNFATYDRENYFYNHSLRWVTQNGNQFIDSEIRTNRFLGEIYIEPSTTYNLVCFESSISLYKLEIYSDSDLVQTLITSGTVFNSSGFTFTTIENIKSGIYKILFREVNTWGSDNYVTTFKYTLTKNNFLLDESFVENDVTKIENLSIDINNLKSIIKSWNITPKNWRYDKALNENGFESPSSTHDTSYMMNCFEDVDYFISHSLWCCFYDKNGTFISRILPQSAEVNIGIGNVHSPKGTKYMRFSVDKTADKNNIICVPTINKTPYTLENAKKKTIPFDLLPSPNNEKTRYHSKKMVSDGDSLCAQQRWQNRVADILGMEFIKNCGIGGTKVTNMCSDERVSKIPDETDVLYLLGGRNDFGQTNNATPLGSIDDEHTNKTFYGAYQLWLDKIFTRLPDVKVIILIPPISKDENIANHLGYFLEQYRQACRDVAYKYGCKIADLRADMNVNHINFDNYYEDDIHFNNLGGKNVAEVVIGVSLGVEPLYR